MSADKYGFIASRYLSSHLLIYPTCSHVTKPLPAPQQHEMKKKTHFSPSEVKDKHHKTHFR